MAKLRVTCPDCDATLALDASAAGKKVRCPKCETIFPVPAPAAAAPADDEPARPRRTGPRRRFKPKKPGASGGAVVAIIAAGVLLAAGGAFGVYKLVNRGGTTVAGRQTDVVPAAGVGTNVGQLVKEIEGEDIDGVKFKLSDYRGKVVVLDFWGHW